MTVPARLWRARPAGWAAFAALVIVLGYVDLWRGGTAFASILLTAGYLVVVPIALLSMSHRPDQAAVTERLSRGMSAPPYLGAALAALFVFALYVFSLAPTTAMWDASEYIAAARVLGIPHPPGNPVFVFVAHAFGLLPIPVSYAARINLLAACASAIAAGFWFLVTDRVLRSWVEHRIARMVGAATAVLIGASSFTVWNQSVVNEKVYTLALLGVAAVSWIALRWIDLSKPDATRTDRLRADHLLLLVAYCCGLGYANHPAGFLPLPAIAVLILATRPRTILRWRLLAGCALTLFLGLTPFLFQPIRAAHSPALNGGKPTACRNGPELACTFSKETATKLLSNINRDQYGGHAVTARQAPLSAQFGMWWTYFERQWLRDAYGDQATLQRALAALFLLLGIAGGVVHWRRDRATWWYVGALMFTVLPALVFYLNFKYAPQQALELGDSVPREVRDRDYFFIWCFSAWGIWAGIGLFAGWERVARWLAQRNSSGFGAVSGRSWMLASPLLLVALIPFIGNAGAAPRRGETFTREWAVDMLNSVEPYGILITNGDNDSFPLWYAQHVEGVRRDITLALAPYLGTDWYVRDLLTRVPEAYDPARGPALYSTQSWTRPTTPPLRLTESEADAVPGYVQFTTEQRFEHGGISATIPAGYLTRDQLIVLHFIKDSFPARPIYFSIGNYPHSMGLGRYVVAHGLAQRLTNVPAESTANVFRHSGGIMDVADTFALWKDFKAPGALVRQDGWIDEPSLSIPTAYAITGQLLGHGLASKGDSASAFQVLETVNDLVRAGRLSR